MGNGMTSPVTRVFIDGVEVPVTSANITYSRTGFDYFVDGYFDTLSEVKLHKADCTIDLNGVIDNESGPYLYCSCGIYMRVKASTDPLRGMVRNLVAQQIQGEPDLLKVQQLRITLREQLETLESLLGVLDGYADDGTSELREWAAEKLGADLPEASNQLECREDSALERPG